MNKRELLMAAMAAGGTHDHTPVQIQKLLFLIDRNVGVSLGGAAFDFKPYDYGPFDSDVYSLLSVLESEGLAQATLTNRGWRKHKLSDAGLEQGEAILKTLPEPIVDYFRRVSEFVRGLSFADLVSAVYKAYPEMKANSVFRG